MLIVEMESSVQKTRKVWLNQAELFMMVKTIYLHKFTVVIVLFSRFRTNHKVEQIDARCQ